MLDRKIIPYAATLLVAIVTALTLFQMGRTVICPCGNILLWYGPLGTDQGNMHLLDWYSPSHLIHGFIFFAVLWLVARRIGLGWRLVLATIIEAAWEIAENTNAVIDRFREVTVSSDYNGDSIVNSMADIVAMWLGFYLARRLPIWASVAICVGFEVLTMALIRDGLALNVLMLLSPIDAVSNWQAGG